MKTVANPAERGAGSGRPKPPSPSVSSHRLKKCIVQGYPVDAFAEPQKKQPRPSARGKSGLKKKKESMIQSVSQAFLNPTLPRRSFRVYHFSRSPDSGINLLTSLPIPHLPCPPVAKMQVLPGKCRAQTVACIGFRPPSQLRGSGGISPRCPSLK